MGLALAVTGLAILHSSGSGPSRSKPKRLHIATQLSVICFAWAFFTGLSVATDRPWFSAVFAQAILAASAIGSAWIVLPFAPLDKPEPRAANKAFMASHLSPIIYHTMLVAVPREEMQIDRWEASRPSECADKYISADALVTRHSVILRNSSDRTDLELHGVDKSPTKR